MSARLDYPATVRDTPGGLTVMLIESSACNAGRSLGVSWQKRVAHLTAECLYIAKFGSTPAPGCTGTAELFASADKKGEGGGRERRRRRERERERDRSESTHDNPEDPACHVSLS